MRLTVIIYTVLFTVTAAINHETAAPVPIILVHGFMGWGRDEMLGFKYWGGVNDLQKEMNKEGHNVMTAAVGPISSNWDRACELFAYIKGGRVDYGEAHAHRNGHARYGRTFPGLFPDWDQENVVNLVGHSMGGQTVRLLVHLLVHGDPAECKRPSGCNETSLFTGGRKGWVRGVASINAPHDGTTLIDLWPNGFVDLVGTLGKGLTAAAGVAPGVTEEVYDFKLDQWGLVRQSGEGFEHYMDRVLNSSIWAENLTDFSSYDLAVEGATNMNGYVAADPGVVYLSYASQDSHESVDPLIRPHQAPNVLMWEFLKPLSYTLGGGWDKKWWVNDGVVNTESEDGPTLNSTDHIVVHKDGDSLKRGLWNYMGCTKGVDHLEMVGMGVQVVKPFYLALAKTLDGLSA